MKVIGGSASIALARGIARELSVGFIDVAFERHPGGFPDGERYVRVVGSVEGEHVILVQTTHPDSMIVELLLLADAVRDAGARRVTAVVPYYGYGRQDKRFLAGEAISAKTIAKHIGVGCDELVTMTIHNPEVLKTFPVPSRDVDGIPAIGRYQKGMDVDLLVAPDENAIRLVKTASAICGKPYDYFEKRRIDSHTVRIAPKKLAVKEKSVAIIDDVISSGGTIATAARELRVQGARRVIAACVHGLFLGNAEASFNACDDVVATDTILSKYSKVSVASEFSEAIRTLA